MFMVGAALEKNLRPNNVILERFKWQWRQVIYWMEKHLIVNQKEMFLFHSANGLHQVIIEQEALHCFFYDKDSLESFLIQMSVFLSFCSQERQIQGHIMDLFNHLLNQLTQVL